VCDSCRSLHTGLGPNLHWSRPSMFQQTVSGYFAIVYFQTMVVAPVLSKMDYGNMLHWLASLLSYLIACCLISILQHTVIRAGVRRSAHVTDILATCTFHWLRAPKWISPSLSFWRNCALVLVWSSLTRLRSTISTQLTVRPSHLVIHLANDHVLLLADSCGTVFPDHITVLPFHPSLLHKTSTSRNREVASNSQSLILSSATCDVDNAFLLLQATRYAFHKVACYKVARISNSVSSTLLLVCTCKSS